MSELYKIHLDPTSTGGGPGTAAPVGSEGVSGGGRESAPPPSPSDYSGTKGAFARQADTPTQAREALSPPTESTGMAESGQATATPETASQTGAVSPPSPWNALRETAKGMGVELPADDQAALHALVSAYQNAGRRDYYAELGAAIAPEYAQYQDWKRATQSQQVPQSAEAQQASPGPWTPPPFDPRWLSVVEEDPQTGRLRSKQGYDPRIGEASQAYADFIQTEQRAFWEDPPTWLARMIGPTVQEMIQKNVQGSFHGYQEQVQANNIIQRNMDWLYNRDQNGRVVLSPQTGRPQLSPYGTRYYQYVEQAAKWGVQDINEQHEYAVGMVERDAYRQQYQAANPNASPTPPGATRSPNVNQLQTMTPVERQDVQPTAPGPGGLSLAEMLRQEFRNSGITDQQLKSEMAGV